MHPGACAEVSKALRVLSLAPASAQAGGTVNVQGETQKGMDVVANDLFVSALTGHVAAMASEEEEEAIAGAANRKYEIAFDPPDPDPNPNPNPNPNLNPNPDPDPNPITLTTHRYMRLHRCQCVQGSTYIRYKPTLLARVIDAEFFVIFFCFFPAIRTPCHAHTGIRLAYPTD